MHYVYVLLSRKDSRFYTGFTSDLRKRIQQHNSGNVESTRYRRPLELAYYEACMDHEDGRAREKYLKSGMGKKYLRNRLRQYLADL